MEISSTSHAGASGHLSRPSGFYEVQAGIAVKESGDSFDGPSDNDIVTLSQEGQELARAHSSSEEKSTTRTGTNAIKNLDGQETQELQELKQRDAQVRTHEQAHLAAAGQYSRGGPSFTYQKGPDGVSYAVGGEVGIDISKEKTPEATITKMQTIKRAALAPASPSAADRSIAAHAGIMEAQARQEILLQRQEELLDTDRPGNPTVDQGVPNEHQKSSKSPPFLAQNALPAMIAAYQRVAGK